MAFKIKRIKIEKGISPIVATVILVLIAVILGAVLASFTTGLFQAVSGQESLDVSLLKIRKINASTVYGAWVVTLQFRNTGQTDITIQSLKITNGTHIFTFIYY
jgi:flagellin-like protein